MKNWELNKRQYLSNLYSHLKERVTNPAKSVEGRFYLGLAITNRESFIQFGLKDEIFSRLFRNYKRSKGVRSKAPSIARRNNNRGYTLDNIFFSTQPKSSSRVANRDKWIVIQDRNTGDLHRFKSTKELSNFLGHSSYPKLTRKSFVKSGSGKVFTNHTDSVNRVSF